MNHADGDEYLKHMDWRNRNLVKLCQVMSIAQDSYAYNHSQITGNSASLIDHNACVQGSVCRHVENMQSPHKKS